MSTPTNLSTRSFPALAIAIAVLSANCLARSAADLIDLRRTGAVVGDPIAGKTKAATCMGCHGAVGIAPVPMFPNLAGQHAEYLYWALVEFQHDPRPDSPMTTQVAKLTEADLRNLAAYFASLALPKARGANAMHTRGAILFHDGDPARGIPPCQGCHGENADGHPLAAMQTRYRAYPKLRGQHADYLVQRLRDFRAGKHTLSSNDRIMTSIAQSLDDASIRDIATWLQTSTP